LLQWGIRPLRAINGLGGFVMEKLQQLRRKQEGKMGWILLWAIGVPIPVLLVLFMLRGCT
jgi:hypothetical protein